MEKKGYLIVIITRMYAKKGSEHDEFVKIWNKDNNKEFEIINVDGNSIIILIHGYEEQYYQNIYEKAKESGNIDINKFEKILFFYHPPAGKELNHFEEGGIYIKYGSNSPLEKIVKDCVDENNAKKILNFIPKNIINSSACIYHWLDKIFGKIYLDIQRIEEKKNETPSLSVNNEIYSLINLYNMFNWDEIFNELKTNLKNFEINTEMIDKGNELFKKLKNEKEDHLLILIQIKYWIKDLFLKLK